MRKKIIILLLTIGMVISVNFKAVTSAEDIKTIEKVIVSADRIEESPDSVSSDVTVITASEMEKEKVRAVIDALRMVPELQVSQTGPYGGEASIYLRGVATGHTIVMVDGVRIYDPMSVETSFNTAHIPIHNIERIEILKGPQSVLYGSNALGGVINIITKRGKGKPHVSLWGGIGSYKSLRAAIESGGSIGLLDYSIAYSTIHTDGISATSTDQDKGENDGYSSNHLSTRVDANIFDNLTLGFLTNYTVSKFDIDDGALEDDINQREKVETLAMVPYVEYIPFEWWKHDFSLAFLRNWRLYWDDSDGNDPGEDMHSFYKGYMYKFSYQNSIYIMDIDTLVTGLEYEIEKGKSYYFLYDPAAWWGTITEISENTRQNESKSFFLNNVFHKYGLHLSYGFRLEDHNRAGKNFTYRMAGAYMLPYELPLGLKDCSTKFRMSYGTAVKNPSIYQLYSQYGDDTLKAEESYGVEGGLEQRFLSNKYYFGITFFQNNLNNLIGFEPIASPPWGRYKNVGGAVLKGVTITSRAKPVDWFSLHWGYTRLYAMDIGDDEPLLRRPEDKFTMGINWQVFNIENAIGKEGLRGDIDINIIAVGNRPDKYYNPVTFATEWKTTEKYGRCDITFNLDCTKHFQSYLRIENLFDASYEETFGYNTPGRNYWFGGRIEF